MIKPLVSIFYLTYNQEQFIEESIRSILDQETNFWFQIVIGEDNSTDDTRAICEKLAQKEPKRIKLLPSLNKNIGLINNYIRTIKECDGKYIAICDGDDYWIDNHKLQKQVDFLEKNSEYSIVYSAIKKLYPNGEFKNSYYTDQYQNASFDDLVFLNFIPSVSVMFKNIQDKENLPNWIKKYPYGDWPTYLWTIKNGGKIHFMKDILAVYRFNIGVSSKIYDFNKIDIGILEDMIHDPSFLNKKNIIKRSIEQKKINRILWLNRNNKISKSFYEFLILWIQTRLSLKLLKMYFYSIKKNLCK